MKTDDELAARALRHRAEEAIVLAERMESAPGSYVTKPAALRDEAAACIRVATRLTPDSVYNKHG